MANATGEAKPPPFKLTFDRRIQLEFHGARITSDGGLLAYRELTPPPAGLRLTEDPSRSTVEPRSGGYLGDFR